MSDDSTQLWDYALSLYGHAEVAEELWKDLEVVLAAVEGVLGSADAVAIYAQHGSNRRSDFERSCTRKQRP